MLHFTYDYDKYEEHRGMYFVKKIGINHPVGLDFHIKRSYNTDKETNKKEDSYDL